MNLFAASKIQRSRYPGVGYYFALIPLIMALGMMTQVYKEIRLHRIGHAVQASVVNKHDNLSRRRTRGSSDEYWVVFKLPDATVHQFEVIHEEYDATKVGDAIDLTTDPEQASFMFTSKVGNGVAGIILVLTFLALSAFIFYRAHRYYVRKRKENNTEDGRARSWDP
jgi:hypothetical protein